MKVFEMRHKKWVQDMTQQEVMFFIKNIKKGGELRIKRVG